MSCPGFVISIVSFGIKFHFKTITSHFLVILFGIQRIVWVFLDKYREK